jgi:heme/copper-type cytochrome/quinol oxidase subunit 2
MYDFLFALHLLFAIFAIGPLVHAATTAGRGVRTGNGSATASAARMLRVYSLASLLVVGVGMGLMSAKDPDSGQKVGAIGDTWIWLSLLLWAVAIALVLIVIAPTLDKATARIGKEESVVSLTARVAAAGGVVGLIFAGIVFVMVYKPGS